MELSALLFLRAFSSEIPLRAVCVSALDLGSPSPLCAELALDPGKSGETSLSDDSVSELEDGSITSSFPGFLASTISFFCCFMISGGKSCT